MKIWLEVEVLDSTIPDHVHDVGERIRVHVEKDLAAWNSLYVIVTLAEDPGEQYNRGYDSGYTAGEHGHCKG